MAFKISKTPNWYKKLLSKDIDSAISGLTANDSTKLIFSTMQPNGICCNGDSSTDPVNPVFIRSTTFWAKNIDTSPISVWNNGGGYAEPLNAGGFGGVGTLISPRHILLANHFQIKVGKKLIFVAMDNTCYIRTLSNSLQVGSSDIRIGLLDSDLPANVSFCKIASQTLSNQPTLENKFPTLSTNVSKKAIVEEGYIQNNNLLVFGVSSNSQRASFFETSGAGNSANPICFVYENKLIIIGYRYTSTGGLTFIAPYINQINTVMNTLGGGYQLSIFDLNPNSPQNKCLIKKNSIGGGKIKVTPLSDSYPNLIRSQTMGFDIFGITTANTDASTASDINSGAPCQRTFILTTIGESLEELFGQIIVITGPILGSPDDYINTYYSGVYYNTNESTLKYSNGLWTLSIKSTQFFSSNIYSFTAVGTRFKIPTNYTQGVYIAANPTAHIECNPFE
jgi:hypothetical protein